MLEMNVELVATAERLRGAFEQIHQSSFAGSALANPALSVEVLPAGLVSTAAGPQEALVLITPWTLNGLLLPGTGLPETLLVAGHPRAVTVMDVPEIGQYAQVNLVPDVSKYTSQRQAHTIGQSMIEPFLLALASLA